MSIIHPAGTPVYVTDPGTGHTGSGARARRHVATILRPMRDYGRATASHYEVTRHDGSWGVYSADYVERRHEGADATRWDATHE